MTLGGLAALIGGLAWAVKAGVILAGGQQPALLFEVAPLLLAGGLLGLLASLPVGGGPRRAGAALAAVAGAAAVYSLAVPVGDGEFSPGLLVSVLALLLGLIVLGVPVRRHRTLGGQVSSTLPLALGITTYPLLGVGGALEAIDPRLLEAPLLVIGVAWMAVGVALVRAGRSRGVELSAPTSAGAT